MNWRNELDIGTESEVITNFYTGESCELTSEGVAVHDFIKGCEVFLNNTYSEEINNQFQEALLYFREKWPNEYLILLD